MEQMEKDLEIDRVSHMRSNVLDVAMYTLEKRQEVPMQEEWSI